MACGCGDSDGEATSSVSVWPDWEAGIIEETDPAPETATTTTAPAPSPSVSGSVTLSWGMAIALIGAMLLAVYLWSTN